MTTLERDQDYPEIRQAVRALCAGFPGAYWRAPFPDDVAGMGVDELTGHFIADARAQLDRTDNDD